MPLAIHSGPTRHRAVFMDRDGVINRNRNDYVKSWDEFELIPHAIEAMALISTSGRDLIVLTNQSAIAQGLVTADVVDHQGGGGRNPRTACCTRCGSRWLH